MKRKRMRFGEVKVGNKRVTIDRDKPLKWFIVQPFDVQRLNFYYMKLAYTLEEGSNRMVFEDLEGNCIPHNKASLVTYLGLCRQYCFEILHKFNHNGIIMQTLVHSVTEFYMNPRFVFCGEEIPQLLLDIFRYDADGIYGEHLFDIEGTLYEKKNKETVLR